MKQTIICSLLIVGISMTAFAQSKLDRTIRPQSSGTPRVDLPDIQKATLRNGLKVWLVEDHELPLIAFNLVLQNGSASDPLNQAGLASMTADVLDEGTTTRSALQIADALDFIGANLTVNAFTDGSSITLSCMTKHVDKAVDVFCDVLVHPTFPAKDFDRLKQQRLTGLLQQRDRASTIASLSFSKLLYGSEHPYGKNPAGSEGSLKEMTREDLVKFYETYYRPNNATLIVVGDAKLTSIVNKLESSLADWKSAEIPKVNFPSTPSITSRKVYLIDKPGAPQSEIRIGYPAVARSTPDFFVLQLANRVLGGQFASRLNLNLREKHGFTYGARSGFTFNKQPGPFTAQAGVTATKTDSSVHEFFYEIDRTAADGVTQTEFDFVKKGFAGGFALSFETPSQIAGALQSIVLYNLPENYFDNYLQNINKVTLDEVNRAAKKYFDSSQMAVVVVGDLKTVREGLEKMKLGEIVLCDVDGNTIQ